MKYVASTLALSLVLLEWSGVCVAHGARCTVIEGGVSVEAVYHDGNPMGFCDVEVFRPGLEEAYHVGTTDPQGRFGFVPDTTGVWKVSVDDAMGHRATAEISVDADRLRTAGPAAMSRIQGLLVGASVIFGVFGLVSLFYRRSRGPR
jgi:hypothetical protein